jgi:hypothetical protein
MSKRNKESQDRYIQLHHYMLRTDAWKSLSPPARAVYVQIAFRYNGVNNGRLALSVRDAASECNVAIGTAARAFKELTSLGFIEETRHGALSKKTRIASEWRLTAFKCDLTGAFKTCAFMHLGEVARASRLTFKRGRRPVPRLYQKNTASVSNDYTACIRRGSDMTPTVSNDCTVDPQKAPSPVSNDCTHIVYQSPRTERRSSFPPPTPRTEIAPTRLVSPPDGLPPAPDMISWTPPRRFTPMEMRQAVDADALTAIEGTFYSNALRDGARIH